MGVHRTLAWLAVVAGTLAAAPAASAQLPFAWRPVEEGGFGDAGNRGVVKLLPYAGQLYAATERRPGTGPAQLWRTGAPGTWHAVRITERGRVRPGNSTMGDALTEFRNQLVVTTRNDRLGADVFKSHDGRVWRVAIGNGVDEPRNHEFPDATVALGDLWMSTTPAPAQVWRVSRDDDGEPPGERSWGFGQANEDGFGRTTVRGGRPAMAGFGDAVYWGGEDQTRGAQVWRLDRNTIQTTEATGPGVQFSPGPLQIARDGTVALGVTCPANDPLGCEADVSLRTQRRFRLGGKLRRLTIGDTIVELDSGQSQTLRFHVTPDVMRILHRAGTVAVRAHSVAGDNAKNNSAVLVLQA